MALNVYFVLLLITSILFCFAQFNRFDPGISLPKGNRAGCLDGLRGYLALMVAGTHYFNFYFLSSTGEWTRKSVFIDSIGTIAVEVFFMITGYLFVTKLLRDIEQGTKTKWVDLYVSRLFRISPLYLFVLLLTAIFTFQKSKWQLLVSPEALLKELSACLLSVGPSLNGDTNATLVTAGVTWTLKYEWGFYMFLPVCAFFIKTRKAFVLVLLGVIAYTLKTEIYGMASIFLFLFVLGGIVAFVYEKYHPVLASAMVSKYMSIVSIVSFFCASLFMNQESKPVADVFVLLFFTPIVFGNSLFGLLKLKSSLILGKISYSIYLIHGVIFHTFFTYFFDPAATGGPLNGFEYMPLLIPLVAFASLLTYKFIERPFIDMGASLKSKAMKEQDSVRS